MSNKEINVDLTLKGGKKRKNKYTKRKYTKKKYSKKRGKYKNRRKYKKCKYSKIKNKGGAIAYAAAATTAAAAAKGSQKLYTNRCKICGRLWKNSNDWIWSGDKSVTLTGVDYNDFKDIYQGATGVCGYCNGNHDFIELVSKGEDELLAKISVVEKLIHDNNLYESNDVHDTRYGWGILNVRTLLEELKEKTEKEQ